MSDVKPDQPWFKATRNHGSFSALPIRWQGWVSLLGFVAAVVLIGMLLLRTLMDLVGPLAVLIYFPVLGLAGWAFYRFVESKSDITDLRR